MSNSKVHFKKEDGSVLHEMVSKRLTFRKESVTCCLCREILGLKQDPYEESEADRIVDRMIFGRWDMICGRWG